MPATSQAQFRFMHGVAGGSIKPPKGLSKTKAAEFVAGQSPKGLPKKVNGREMQRKRQIKRR